MHFLVTCSMRIHISSNCVCIVYNCAVDNSLPEMNTVYGTSIILPYNVTSFLIIIIKHYFEILLVLSIA